MATNSAKGTIVAQTGYNGGWNSYGSAAMYAGKESGVYYPYILKFTTPDFVGVSEKITIHLGVIKGYHDSPTLRYSVCTSDANRDKYINTYSNVSDSYKIANGTITMSGISTSMKTFSVSFYTTELQPNTTYYLYLYGYASYSMWVTIMETSNHSIWVGWNAGLVYIDNGSSLEAYQCYVDNGTSWDLVIPYVDNGTGWDMA